MTTATPDHRDVPDPDRGLPPDWRDPALPVDARVDALLAAMTLPEKVGQLGSAWTGDVAITGDVAPMQDVLRAGGPTYEQARVHGLGHFTRIYGTAPIDPVRGAARLVELQSDLVEHGRLGIPAIVHEECLTGFTSFGATVYPAAIAWGASFDPDLVGRMAHAIGADLHALGVHQGLSPLLDVVRDYRWGRVEETIGEDPYLVGLLGSAYVRGLQDAGVLATLKHFAGYSASRGARNHAPVAIGRRELQDLVLTPFEMAVRAGAGSVMNSYSDVDGVPAAADPWLLTTVLREEWGFTGTVVSDYWAVPFLHRTHQVAADNAEAAALALTAGLDVELPETQCYGPGLVELVRSGTVAESLVDRAARRVLLQKARLGLLDPDWTPQRSVAAAASVDLDSAGNRAIARDLAERSVILLANTGTLPLAPDRATRIAVVGPCADDPLVLMGCYSFPNHVLPHHPGLGMGVVAPSVYAALVAEFPAAEFTLAAGCPIRDADRSGLPAAVDAARAAQLCVVVVGDRAGMFGLGTSGEGCDVTDLALPGVQGELVEAVLGTGTPVVLVTVSGRPYAIGGYAGRAVAAVQAFMPGEEGGPAIAGVLSGRIAPAGRLPVQIPGADSPQPSTYLAPPLGANGDGISNLDPTPAFPFGHGLTYTTFAYTDLALSATEIPTDGELTVDVTVTNTGTRAGDEVVQLYLHDVQGQVTRPVRQLAGFTRVALEPGRSARVGFRLHADRTAFTGIALRRIVEPGRVEVFVGRSAADLPCRGDFLLTGAVRQVGSDRVLTTPVTVEFAKEW